MADGKSPFYANLLLDRLGGGEVDTLTTVYLALFDAAGTELSGGGYVRKAVTTNPTNFPAASSRSISNGTDISFTAATTAWSDVYRIKIMDASSGGNVLYQSFLGSDGGRAFTAKADDVITVPGHALSVDDRVAVLAVDGSTLPTGLTDETLYYIKTVSGDDVTLSLTANGSTINVTAAGSGVIKKVTPKTGMASGDSIRIAAGQLTLRES